MKRLKQFFFLSLITTPLWAASNKLINVQGKLMDSTGKPLGGPASPPVTVIFRLYTSPNPNVVTSGSCPKVCGQVTTGCVWTESQSFNTTSIGLFNVAIGNVCSLDPIPFNTPYYLGIQVAGDNNELTPRQLLGASAYALGSLGDFNVQGNLFIQGKNVGNYLIPPGTILPFAGTTAPNGYLPCDGSAVSRSTYPDLFAALGTTWGIGDGSKTFNLPDFRGRAPIGAGQGLGLTNRIVGQENIGEEVHTLTVAEIPTHTHGVIEPNNGQGHTHGVSDPGHGHGGGVSNPGGQVATGASGLPRMAFANTGTSMTGISISASPTGITLQNTGGGSAHNTMPPSAVINFIIKS